MKNKKKFILAALIASSIIFPNLVPYISALNGILLPPSHVDSLQGEPS